ncbi:MAG: phosphate/phosphite/phosphonate ABC transporter substrate-binding protein [Myxococcales bacterium]|nr:phosphate/phosphite/phosphonate ABC transporter substrate-binding protein [Myxococcales bacterium]
MTLLLALLACATPLSSAPPPAPAETVPVAPWVAPPGFTQLRMSLTPYLDPAELLVMREPVRAWLSERLGVPVELRVATSYDELGDLLRTGDVDVGEFSPYGYVRARAKDPTLAPLVSQIAYGTATAGGYIVVRADSPLATLDDLRGRRFAFVDPASTTGFLYPHMLLTERGIDPERDFSEVAFMGNHKAVLLAVYNGTHDAGAVYQSALPALERSDDIDAREFRIIGKTRRTPRDLVCARAGLAIEVRTEIQRLLLSLSVRSAEGRRVLSLMHVNGFVPTDDRLFDPIREADARLRAEP